MKIQVKRHLFFAQNRRVLRYTEAMPPHVHAEGALCNCTDEVKVRPEGAPYETQEIVTLSADVAVGDVTYRVQYDTFYRGFSVYSGDAERAGGGDVPHLYAWVKDTQVHFEYVADPDSNHPRDVAIGYLYAGLPSDNVRETMFRGHSPPRIDLTPFANAVWLYDRFGSTAEATHVLHTVEANAWRQYVRIAREMGTRAQLGSDESVVAAYQRILCDDELRTFFVTWAPWFANLMHHAPTSEVYEGIRAMETL